MAKVRHNHKGSHAQIELHNLYTNQLIFSGKGTFKDALLQAIAANADLRGLNAAGQDLSGFHISAAVAQRTTPLSFAMASFNDCNMEGSSWTGADLTQASFTRVKGKDMTLQKCVINKTLFVSMNAPGLRIGESEVKEAFFTGSDLQNAHFDVARIDNVFFNSDLRGATFKPKSTLKDVDFGLSNISGLVARKVIFEHSSLGTGMGVIKNADFERAQFRNSQMALTEYEGCNFSSTRWSHGCTVTSVSLEACNLEYVHMKRSDLCRVNMKGVNMSNADLSVNFVDSILAETNISSSVFSDSKLHKIEFIKVQASNTDFGNSDMEKSELKKCQWPTAKMKDTFGVQVKLDSESLLPDHGMHVQKEARADVMPQVDHPVKSIRFELGDQ